MEILLFFNLIIVYFRNRKSNSLIIKISSHFLSTFVVLLGCVFKKTYMAPKEEFIIIVFNFN